MIEGKKMKFTICVRDILLVVTSGFDFTIITGG